MSRLLVVALGLGVGLAVLEHPTQAQELPPADTAWRYSAPSKIEYLRDCADAEQLLTTKNALIALDASTGAALWQLDKLPSVGAGLSWGSCGATTGLSYRKDRIVAFDMVSGRQLWDGSALPPFQEIRGYFRSDNEDILFVFLRTASSDRSLAAVQLSTGSLRWQRDDLFAQSPKFAGTAGVSDIVEYQTLIADTDTTLIVYMSPDGPMRLDMRTGATLWRAEALAGRRVPSTTEHAAMVLVDSVLVIPRDKGLLGIDASDGRVLWEAPSLFPVKATRMLARPYGLVVRAGRAYLTLLDPATGESRWPTPLTVETDGVAYTVAEDRYYVVSKDRLLVAALTTGDTLGLATLAFGGGEHAERLFWIDGGLMVAARQNLSVIDADGNQAYHRYFKAPGASFFEKVSGVLGGSFGVFSARFGTATFRSEYAYFLTEDPDATGRTGYSVVRVALEDGQEAGRLWFRERAPAYRPDTARDQLLYQENDKTLVALRFPTSPVP